MWLTSGYGHLSKKCTMLKMISLEASGSDDRIEGCALISSCESTKTSDSWRKIIDRRMLDSTKKRYPHLKIKKKPQWDSRMGSITIKSNLIASGQTTIREGVQPHPSADNWIKALLSKALSIRTRSRRREKWPEKTFEGWKLPEHGKGNSQPSSGSTESQEG